MFSRRLTLIVENKADKADLLFGGEYFETGGWQGGVRTDRIGESAILEFESTAWMQGVSGYVYYHNVDHSQNLVVAFACPIATAACFTARAGEMLIDCKALYDRVPDLARPGAGLRRADGCAWETLDLLDEHATVRCIVLPGDGGSSFGEELGRRLAKAKLCRSTLTDDRSALSGRSLVERQVVIEIDNRSDEAFVLDGEFFETGRWLAAPVSHIKKNGVTKLEFLSEEVLHGITGLVWFVSETGLDTYFSAVFCNPLAGTITFNAWAGPPPAELLAEMYTAPAIPDSAGVQVPEGQGCAWNVLEQGAIAHIRLVILEGIAPMDLSAYPPRTPEQVAAAEKASAQAKAKAKAKAAPVLSSSTALMTTQTGQSEEMEDPFQNMDGFMRQTRPRDALEGLGSGLKVAGCSLAVGVGVLISAPVIGAKTDGVKGFCGGLVQGVLGAGCAVVGGAVAGTTQVVRGIANTPDAIAGTTSGKKWDVELGEWVDDTCNLRGEAGTLTQEDLDGHSDDEAEAADKDGRTNRRVADTTYYDAIGVEPSASGSMIKKAYYKVALKVHPDKNPDDPTAAQRFQELAHAYQILSDPKLRERYDSLGKDAMSDQAMPSVDPALFFNMLFGSEQFEKYIGKLYIAMQTDHIAKDLQKDLERRARQEDGQVPARDVIGDSLEREMKWGDSKRDQKMKRQQFVREVSCASKLCERLDRWVIGRDEVGFMSSTAQEACELVRVSFGSRLLRTLGTVYEGAALQYFAALRGNFTLETQVNQWRESYRQSGTRMQAMSSVVKSGLAVKKMHDVAGATDNDEAGEGDQEKKEEAARQAMHSLEESLPVFLQTIWDVSVVDIETTTIHICDKALKDISVPWQIRHRRAIALQRLGRLFRDSGQVEHTDLTQSQVAKQHLEEALYGAIKEQG